MGRRFRVSPPLPARQGAIALVALVLIGSPPAPVIAGAEDPHFVSSMLWAMPGEVKVSDGRAYVAFPNGLAVYDVASPEAPVLLGRVEVPGVRMMYGYGFDVAGSHAFLARHGEGVRIVDASDPQHPREVGAISVYQGDIWDVAVSGEYAFLASGLNGLLIYDVSDPASPQWVGDVPLPGWVLRIFVDGSYAYVSNDLNGFAVIDVSDPAHPTHVAQTPPLGASWDVYVSDGIAYCTYTGGQRGDGPRGAPPGTGRSIGKERPYDPSGVIIYDVHDPRDPILRSVWPNPDFTYSVFVRDHLAYVGSSFGCVTILDVSDPAAPVTAGRFETGGDAYDVALAGTVAHIADGRGGFTTADVSDPAATVLLGNTCEATFVNDVRLRDELAITADSGFGLHVVDVRDPGHPRIVGDLQLPLRSVALEVAGDHAYVSGSDSGLRIVDLTDPEHLRVVGTLAVPVRHTAVSGSLACVVASDEDLRVVDVAVPESPVIIGTCPLPDWPCSVTMDGSLAYVACGDAGMRIVDLSDPRHPYLCGSYDPYGYISDVLVRSGYAYLSIRNHGRLEVVDVSIPGLIRLLAGIEIGPFVEGGCLVGDRLYLATEGVAVVDVTLPDQPAVIGHCATHCGGFTVQRSGPFLYTADAASLMIFGPEAAAVPGEPGIDAVPGLEEHALRIENPVHGQSTIHWRLAEAGPVRIEVIDAGGARRGVLYEGIAGAGENTWKLNARALGLASGTYLLRAGAGDGRVETRPIQIVR